MAALIGIDGCRAGWVGAHLVDATVSWRVAPIGAVHELIVDCTVAGIDMPIGLCDTGWRSCDVEAKRELGRAGSRVFMTPPRAVVELGLSAPNAVAQARSRELTGQGVSRQALALSSRILDVDRLLPDARLIEVHPELSFLELTGEALNSKHTADGLTQRQDALRGWRPDVDALIDARPTRVAIDDALDALVVLWSAQRWLHGTAHAIPNDPPIDANGTPMRIVR